MHPVVARYKRAETELQSVLDEISGRIGRAVSEQVKTPLGIHFLFHPADVRREAAEPGEVAGALLKKAMARLEHSGPGTYT